MATSKNFILKGMSGSLNKQLVIKQYGDLTVVSKYPDMSKRKLSVKQRRMNELMEEANYEARSIIANDTLRREAQVRLDVPRNRLYTALVSEYFQKAKEQS